MPEMPLWVQYAPAVAVLVVALVVWWKVIRPGARLAAAAEEALPLLRRLAETFGDAPPVHSVLDRMAAQLTEIVNHLEYSAEVERVASEILRAGVASERKLSAVDREQMLRLVILLNQLGVVVTASAATGERIERHGFAVADDLAKAHGRANEVTNGEPGAAADAAAQHTE